MFQDGKVVFVRHGAVFVRVSPNRLQKVTSYLADDGDRKSEHSLEDRDDEKQDEKEEPNPTQYQKNCQLQVPIRRIYRIFNRTEKRRS